MPLCKSRSTLGCQSCADNVSHERHTKHVFMEKYSERYASLANRSDDKLLVS